MPNIIQRALMAFRAYPAPLPMTWQNLMGDRGGSSTGISVNPHTALDYSPVWSGVSTLSRDIAKLPLQLYKNLPNGGKEPFKTHKLYRILHDEPNPEMTSFKFRETMQALCLLYGNSYAEIVRNDVGQPVGLYPIVPSRVAAMRMEGSGLLRYRVTNAGGGQVYVLLENMIHLSTLTTDGIIGHSIVEHARESFGLGIATEKFGGSFFGNGATFGGVLNIPGQLTDPNVKNNIREAIDAVHQGVDRAHKILVIGGDTKFTARGTNPNEAQFIETRKFQISEVARWLNMPPHKLGDLENAHFTNIEEQELQYYVGCVSGWLEMWEQELSRKLIAKLEYGQQTIEHNLSGVLRGDSAARAEFYSKMHGLGAFSINDILRKENMNPIGPEGDVHLVPLNMVPIERYDEMITAQIESKKPQALPAAKEPDPADAERAKQAEEQREALLASLRTSIQMIGEGTEKIIAAKENIEMRRYEEQTEAARQAQVAAEARVADEQAARQRAEQAAVEALELESQSRVALAEATERLEATLSAKVSEAQAEVAAHAAAVDAALADVAVKSQALTEAQGVALEQTALAAAHAAATAEAEARAAALQAALDQAQQDLQIVTEERAQLAAKAADVEAQIGAHQAAERARLTRSIVAHRALIQDAVQRIARTETERARKRGATPDNLKRWMDAFYDETGREAGAKILAPAVGMLLSWKQSDEDPSAVAQQLADEYYGQSERQLRAIAEGMVGEEFQSTLDKTLTRWEHERPAALADKVLSDALEYLHAK